MTIFDHAYKSEDGQNFDVGKRISTDPNFRQRSGPESKKKRGSKKQKKHKKAKIKKNSINQSIIGINNLK